MIEDPMVARIALAQSAAKARADRLVALLPAAVTLLERHGATQVWLFGSLASGAMPHADTDVDLCVSGLDLASCAEALLDLERLFAASVDLVRLESASEHLRRRIGRTWREITDVTG